MYFHFSIMKYEIICITQIYYHAFSSLNASNLIFVDKKENDKIYIFLII